MNRVINNPDLVVEDMLRGILAAHPELSAAPANPRVVSHARAREAGRVGIVTGGGSGHEPAFIGYDPGRNLVDAVAIGEIFLRRPPNRSLTLSRRLIAAQALHAFMAITPATT